MNAIKMNFKVVFSLLSLTILIRLRAIKSTSDLDSNQNILYSTTNQQPIDTSASSYISTTTTLNPIEGMYYHYR